MISLTDLQRQARATPQAQFLLRYPEPALLVYESGEPGGADHDTDRQGLGPGEAAEWLSKTEGAEWLSKTYEDMRSPKRVVDLPLEVHFVRKAVASGNPFPNLVSIGRMKTNDVVLNTTVISKLHAAILLDPPGRDGRRTYQLSDQRSTNGTFLDGDRLAAGERRPLHDGAWIGLGSQRLRFVLPVTLHGFLLDPEVLD